MIFSEPEDYRLTDTTCGISLIKKSHAITNPARHFHPWWEILYIASGERTFFYANRTLHIGAGTFLCIAPGILHRAINPAGESCRLYNVFFSEGGQALPPDNPRFVSLLPVLQACNPCIALPPEMQDRVSHLFSCMGKELITKEAGWETLVWSYLGEILVAVSRQKMVAGVALQPTVEMKPHLAAAIDYLNVHYTEPLTLSSVAERFHLSPSHLSRSFKAATHFGFVEYVNSLRVSRACRLLSDTQKSVLDIAMECGFGSVTQFGRCFKELAGTNPLSYRFRH